MLSKSLKGNFDEVEGGSLGMRRVKMVNSPLFTGDLKGYLELDDGVEDIENAEQPN
jgi:hypothetical protein